MLNKYYISFFSLFYLVTFLFAPLLVKATSGGFTTITPDTVTAGQSISYTVSFTGSGGDGSKVIAAVYYRKLFTGIKDGEGWNNVVQTFGTDNVNQTYSWSTAGLNAGQYQLGLFTINGRDSNGNLIVTGTLDTSGNLTINSIQASDRETEASDCVGKGGDNGFQQMQWTIDGILVGRMRVCQNNWTTVPAATAGYAKIDKISGVNFSTTGSIQFYWISQEWSCDINTLPDASGHVSCAAAQTAGVVQNTVRTIPIPPGYTKVFTAPSYYNLQLQGDGNGGYCGSVQEDMATVRMLKDNSHEPDGFTGTNDVFWSYARSNNGCPIKNLTPVATDNQCSANPPTENITANWTSFLDAHSYQAILRYVPNTGAISSKCVVDTPTFPRHTVSFPATSPYFSTGAVYDGDATKLYSVSVIGFLDTNCSITGTNNSASANVTNACTGGIGGTGRTPTVACSVSPASANTNSNVTWTIDGISGSGTSYSYTWTNTTDGQPTSSPLGGQTGNVPSVPYDKTVQYTSVGTKYGYVTIKDDLTPQNSSLVTSCGSVTVAAPGAPTVNLKANGTHGSISIPNNSTADLVWTTTNATSCTASGSWTTATVTANGGASGGSWTTPTLFNAGTPYTYNIDCQGSGGQHATDSVTVNVNAPAGGTPCPTGTTGYQCAASSPSCPGVQDKPAYTCASGACYYCPPTTATSTGAWIQTAGGGDVHSNTYINTPGGP